MIKRPDLARDHSNAPVLVSTTHNKEVWLQIGESARGQSRHALLTADEARRIGIALVAAAETAEPQQVPTPHSDRIVAALEELRTQFPS